MTSATIPGLDTAPTNHQGLLSWVEEVAELTQPDRVVFTDGSEEEFQRLCDQLVEAGTFIRLNPRSTRTPTWHCRIRPMSRGWSRGRTSARRKRSTPAPPTTGWIPAKCGPS